MSLRQTFTTLGVLLLLIPAHTASSQLVQAKTRIHTLTVEATYTDGEVKINRDFHDHAHLEAGDVLEWVLRCDSCPDGSILEIDNVHNLANLSLLGREERVRLLTETEQNKLVHPDYKGAATYDPGYPFLGPLTRVDNLTVRSRAYREFEHEHLWKFDWVVSVGAIHDRWDPHFSGSRRGH